jgi:hypothetical protein
MPPHILQRKFYVISPMRTICPAHFILVSTQVSSLFVVQFKSWISSLCSALYLLINVCQPGTRVSQCCLHLLPFTCLLRLIAFSVYFIKYHLKRSIKSTTNVFSKSCKLKDSLRSGTDVCQILKLQRRKRRFRQACCEILDVMLFRIREIYK